MQVELVHRNDLRVTSTGSSTLDTERGTLRRLSNTSESGFAEMSSERLSETDRRGRLSFSERSRRDTGDDDVFTVPMTAPSQFLSLRKSGPKLTVGVEENRGARA